MYAPFYCCCRVDFTLWTTVLLDWYCDCLIFWKCIQDSVEDANCIANSTLLLSWPCYPRHAVSDTRHDVCSANKDCVTKPVDPVYKKLAQINGEVNRLKKKDLLQLLYDLHLPSRCDVLAICYYLPSRCDVLAIYYHLPSRCDVLAIYYHHYCMVFVHTIHHISTHINLCPCTKTHTYMYIYIYIYTYMCLLHICAYICIYIVNKESH